MTEPEKSKIVPNTFQTPNVLIDQYMQYLTGDECKCYLVIVRKTLGWLKRTDHISASQISGLTGISENGVMKNMKSLVTYGLVIRVSENDPNKNFGIEWALQMNDTLVDLQALQDRKAKHSASNAARTSKMRKHISHGGGGDVAHGGGGDVAHAPQKPLSKATIKTIAPDGASDTPTVEPPKPAKRPLPNREPGGTDAKRKGDVIDGMKLFAAKQIDTIDLSWLEESLRPRALAFWQGSGIAPMPDERNYWRKELKAQYDAGITPDQIKRACLKMRADGLTIKSPASIRAIAKDLPNQLAPRPPSELPPMTQSTRPPAAAYELLARLKAQSEPNPQETIHELPQM